INKVNRQAMRRRLSKRAEASYLSRLMTIERLLNPASAGCTTYDTFLRLNFGGDSMASVSLKGNPVTLVGAEVKVGQDAPDFKLQKTDMSDYTLASGAGKTRIIAAVPSLDTPVCDMETRRFNEEAAKLPNVEIVAVSMDLPFAMKR